MRILSLFLGFALFFSGCAPQYVVKNQYIPPTNNSKACLQECFAKKENLKHECQREYKECLKDAFELSKLVWAKSNENYKNRYDKYVAKLNEYNFDIFSWQKRYDERYGDWRYFAKKCSKKGDKYACRRESDLRYEIEKLKIDRPKRPREPQSVTFDEILDKQQSKCSKKCDDNELYDSCFVGCGGEIIPYKICVRNCD